MDFDVLPWVVGRDTTATAADYADADLLAVTGRTPCSRLDVVSGYAFAVVPPSQRHLDALATNGGELCGLVLTLMAFSRGGRRGCHDVATECVAEDIQPL